MTWNHCAACVWAFRESRRFCELPLTYRRRVGFEECPAFVGDPKRPTEEAFRLDDLQHSVLDECPGESAWGRCFTYDAVRIIRSRFQHGEAEFLYGHGREFNMRVAVISCDAYADTWLPFVELLNHFWPTHPPVTLITDKLEAVPPSGYESVFVYDSPSWCAILRAYAFQCDEPVCLFLDDFFLTAPVQEPLIERGLEQMQATGAGCVRLYPCPGGEEEYGDPHFALVPRGTRYRISLQVGIWRPSYLVAVAAGFDNPWDFEIQGSAVSDELPPPVLAFKRAVQPWPVEYLVSAIGRSLWSPAAKTLCDSLHIEADWTMRGFQPA